MKIKGISMKQKKLHYLMFQTCMAADATCKGRRCYLYKSGVEGSRNLVLAVVQDTGN